MKSSIVKLMNYDFLCDFQCSEEVDARMSLTNNLQKINRISPSSSSENGTDKVNIFNVARVKKVELNDLPALAKVDDDTGKF